MQTINLNGQWDLSGGIIPKKIKADVPGTVDHALLSNDILPDPFYRDNEDFYLAAANDSYTYERSFETTEKLLGGKEIKLICKGIDTLADIYINGKFLANVSNMHVEHAIDIKNFLKKGKNTIKITISSPLKYFAEENAKDPLRCPGECTVGAPHLRKTLCMSGWDWGPRIPDAGIWRDIYIESYEEIIFENVDFTQVHTKGNVNLGAKVNYKNLSGASITAKMFIGGELTCETTDCELSFNIKNPKLWNPSGLGEQHLYNVSIKLYRGKTLLFEKDYKIGLRTIRVVRNEDEFGQSFYFEVNGHPVFAKGSNYIPEDNLFSRINKDKSRKLLQHAKLANHNIVRVWGGGYYPDDYFYEICDELGLLVWQDLMFACAVYPNTVEFLNDIAAEADYNVNRIKHHACIALICGNNECEEGLEHWWKNSLPHKVSDYIRQYEVVLKDAVKRAAPDLFYWPSSPSAGGGCYGTKDYNRGDTHYWEVWHFKKPFTEYQKHYFRFASEFGFQSFPCIETVESFTEPGDRNIFSYIMEKHQRHGSANGLILHYLSETLKYPKDFDSLLYASQILQAEAIRFGVEHWRRNRNKQRCMGSIYWQLNDCWPVASWSSIDYYGRWKALHYSSKRFYAPLLLSLVKNEKGLFEFHVTNDTLKTFKGKMTFAAKDVNGKVYFKGEDFVAAKPLCDTLVTAADINVFNKKHAEKEIYIEFRLYNEKGMEFISGGNYYLAPLKHIELKKPNITADIEKIKAGLKIIIKSDTLAVNTEIKFKGVDAVLSDNYFDISKDETREITVNYSDMSKELTKDEALKLLEIRSLYNTYA